MAVAAVNGKVLLLWLLLATLSASASASSSSSDEYDDSWVLRLRGHRMLTMMVSASLGVASVFMLVVFVVNVVAADSTDEFYALLDLTTAHSGSVDGFVHPQQQQQYQRQQRQQQPRFTRQRHNDEPLLMPSSSTAASTSKQRMIAASSSAAATVAAVADPNAQRRFIQAAHQRRRSIIADVAAMDGGGSGGGGGGGDGHVVLDDDDREYYQEGTGGGGGGGGSDCSDSGGGGYSPSVRDSSSLLEDDHHHHHHHHQHHQHRHHGHEAGKSARDEQLEAERIQRALAEQQAKPDDSLVGDLMFSPAAATTTRNIHDSNNNNNNNNNSIHHTVSFSHSDCEEDDHDGMARDKFQHNYYSRNSVCCGCRRTKWTKFTWLLLLALISTMLSGAGYALVLMYDTEHDQDDQVDDGDNSDDDDGKELPTQLLAAEVLIHMSSPFILAAFNVLAFMWMDSLRLLRSVYRSVREIKPVLVFFVVVFFGFELCRVAFNILENTYGRTHPHLRDTRLMPGHDIMRTVSDVWFILACVIEATMFLYYSSGVAHQLSEVHFSDEVSMHLIARLIRSLQTVGTSFSVFMIGTGLVDLLCLFGIMPVTVFVGCYNVLFLLSLSCVFWTWLLLRSLDADAHDDRSHRTRRRHKSGRHHHHHHHRHHHHAHHHDQHRGYHGRPRGRFDSLLSDGMTDEEYYSYYANTRPTYVSDMPAGSGHTSRGDHLHSGSASSSLYEDEDGDSRYTSGDSDRRYRSNPVREYDGGMSSPYMSSYRRGVYTSDSLEHGVVAHGSFVEDYSAGSGRRWIPIPNNQQQQQQQHPHQQQQDSTMSSAARQHRGIMGSSSYYSFSYRTAMSPAYYHSPPPTDD